MPRTTHPELHRTERIGWLRAAVLGANDGIVSTASLMVGVAAAGTGRGELLVTGIAGLVAGAMSMAAGEYVSVRSQADTERADVGRERAELASEPALEKQELASIYVARGLSPDLAGRVAEELMTHDALGAHARDELGISAQGTARPVQASLTSAVSFAAGSAFPLLTALAVPSSLVLPILTGASVLMLAALGGLAARAGRAPVVPASIRVAVLGGLAMAVTAGVGRLFGAVV
jgi:VIT1/CCC1 family predicted Fe2+/Mn2+ transporter